MKKIRIAIWFGYQGYVCFKNEGIARALYYMINFLLKNYDIEFELWCYNINKEEIEEYYITEIINLEHRSRISIFTDYDEQNIHQSFRIILKSINKTITGISWQKPYIDFLKNKNSYIGFKKLYIYLLSLLILIKTLTYKVFMKSGLLKYISAFQKDNDRLAKKANRVSNADCFIIPIVNLDNGLQLNKIKIVMLYDLVSIEFADLFIKNDPGCVEWIEKGRKTTEAYLKQNSFFFTISKYVIDNQFVRFINKADKEMASCIYLASMVDKKIIEHLVSFQELRKKYNLKMPYIIFPSQIRPHKNVITLLKSLMIINETGLKIKLVLTGYIEHNKEVSDFIKSNRLEKMICFTKNVSELELYSLYKHSSAMVSPSFFEGGFPLQALEAFAFNIPVILADIPVTRERLKFAGLDCDKHGLELFDPENEKSLADIIIKVVNNKDKYIKKQKNARESLLAYNWDDASREYYNSIIKVIERPL